MQADLGSFARVPVQIYVRGGRRKIFHPLVASLLLDPMQHCLYVLARAQLVGGEIGTGAVIGPTVNGPDVHPIADREMGGRGDGACAPCPVPELARDVLDRDLGSPALYALADRTLRGSFDFPRCLASGAIGEKCRHSVRAGLVRLRVAAAAVVKIAVRVIRQLHGDDVLGLFVLHVGPQRSGVPVQTRDPVFPKMAQARTDDLRSGQSLNLFAVEEEGILLGEGRHRAHERKNLRLGNAAW